MHALVAQTMEREARAIAPNDLGLLDLVKTPVARAG